MFAVRNYELFVQTCLTKAKQKSVLLVQGEDFFIVESFSLIVARNAVDLSYKKPAPAGTFCDRWSAKDRDIRNALYKHSVAQLLLFKEKEREGHTLLTKVQ